MDFCLKQSGLYFTESEKLRDHLTIEIGKSEMFYVAFGDTELQFRPDFLQRLVVEFSALLEVYKWPVDVQQIEVF